MGRSAPPHLDLRRNREVIEQGGRSTKMKLSKNGEREREREREHRNEQPLPFGEEGFTYICVAEILSVDG